MVQQPDRRDAPIALFDSGAGGISVLREVQKLLPCEQLLYFGDTANAPYGEKETKEILSLVQQAAARLIPHVKALVLACNTATAIAADLLRAQYPNVPIIGMEPALAPAVRAVQTKRSPRVLVLATGATLRGEKFASLCKRYEKSATVLSISAPGIVRLVEAGKASSHEMNAYLAALFAPLPALPDAVVLGCTHFPFAKNAIRQALGGAPLFDGAAGTAAQLQKKLTEAGLNANASRSGGVLLTSSAPHALSLMTDLYERSSL